MLILCDGVEWKGLWSHIMGKEYGAEGGAEKEDEAFQDEVYGKTGDG